MSTAGWRIFYADAILYCITNILFLPRLTAVDCPDVVADVLCHCSHTLSPKHPAFTVVNSTASITADAIKHVIVPERK